MPAQWTWLQRLLSAHFCIGNPATSLGNEVFFYVTQYLMENILDALQVVYEINEEQNQQIMTFAS